MFETTCLEHFLVGVQRRTDERVDGEPNEGEGERKGNESERKEDWINKQFSFREQEIGWRLKIIFHNIHPLSFPPYSSVYWDVWRQNSLCIFLSNTMARSWGYPLYPKEKTSRKGRKERETKMCLASCLSLSPNGFTARGFRRRKENRKHLKWIRLKLSVEPSIVSLIVKLWQRARERGWEVETYFEPNVQIETKVRQQGRKRERRLLGVKLKGKFNATKEILETQLNVYGAIKAVCEWAKWNGNDLRFFNCNLQDRFTKRCETEKGEKRRGTDERSFVFYPEKLSTDWTFLVKYWAITKEE